MFQSIEKLKHEGFEGFKTIQELNNNHDIIPKQKGVYFILNDKTIEPVFLETGCGGYYKQKNPNVIPEVLKKNWVKHTHTLYIGKANNLRRRLKLYLDFGKGRPVSHQGGRYIWQLSHSDDLIVCWKILDSEVPRSIEEELIRSFKSQFGDRPFANLQD
ncbi:hypothetical protein HQ865_16705 [Mucilaginibacter mali]|uniref:GIY-YIG domain-containing protein n=1 Tax=Mucilaginibacter mali TaxID=2740462 RepID=A0A7D4QGR8_9SPHI|nr:GIY-YIG nuclease family protein [Mucilaginibacter mali]QKJ31332.1 hypothetical protein HQ865_16705 [Mucilaginibacter mali]